ncbi:ISC system 2Fe-2S type ferredoxin [Candidatus Thiodictyon syntrophicum]|jgi:2Fe-2S ferredoxin|uniref:2Fe-2S ferredoxin n=1 Tax=Candidatus Thiodictyon syntrophicum TaxID=1166950 RepID=A0A2K8UEZ6_9GAMM|nr:ISC system 2Fe-2S type ferredoxin [Candidatus Thiodictyon syntrophicum]AUB84112.1 ISC system 2Fe-2S type ferredoxin [Candidatus Thiodictyon syntrophicum]
MPQLTFLPHQTLCPRGASITAQPGISICDAALAHGIEIEHACDRSCACTTCHVILRAGGDSLAPPDDLEEDLLDRAWGLEAESRLSCQALVGEADLVIEIPRYTINMVSERR